MHAGSRHEPNPHIRILALLEPEDVHPEDALGRIVLYFARQHARPAARTPLQIDYHSVFSIVRHLLCADGSPEPSCILVTKLPDGSGEAVSPLSRHQPS